MSQSWTIDTLIASVKDHTNRAAEEPIKAFTTVFKVAEERRVLSRINKKPSGSTAPGSTISTNSSGSARPRVTVGHCNHCNKEHPGSNDQCWIAHPESCHPTSQRRDRNALP
jgi:hypothetical protein